MIQLGKCTDFSIHVVFHLGQIQPLLELCLLFFSLMPNNDCCLLKLFFSTLVFEFHTICCGLKVQKALSHLVLVHSKSVTYESCSCSIIFSSYPDLRSIYLNPYEIQLLIGFLFCSTSNVAISIQNLWHCFVHLTEHSLLVKNFAVAEIPL